MLSLILLSLAAALFVLGLDELIWRWQFRRIRYKAWKKIEAILDETKGDGDGL